MASDPQTQSYLVALGLVVVGLFGVVVVWKIAKSLFKLVFWLAALLAVITLAWWLLAREGIVPSPQPVGPPPHSPASNPMAA